MQLKFLKVDVNCEADMHDLNQHLKRDWNPRKPIPARTGDSQTFLILLEKPNDDMDGD